MSGNTLDVTYNKVNGDELIGYISNQYDTWKMGRASWEEDTLRTRDYLYATRTNTTQNAVLPFSNNTTIPKVTQLAEILHANYMKSLFGIDPWFKWVGDTKEAQTKEKVKIINAYIGTKLDQSEALNTLSLLVRDWIETGNCFAKLIWENSAVYDPKTGKQIAGYVGPRIMRISYLDIVFNLTATSFYTSPKIVKYLKTVGELYDDAETNPDSGITIEMLDNLSKDNIQTFGRYTGNGISEMQKSRGYSKDGFAAYQYYNNSSVEILEFSGDIFYNKKLYKNRRITILNREYLIRNEEIPSWSGSNYLYACAWRKRPDNVMGMGPLDNIIGMQYKIDKLENQRADIFDQYAYPQMFIRGDVQQQGNLGDPGSKYYGDKDASIDFLRPDPLALNADTQIGQTLQLMELMALTPPQSYGFRQPGEKTATEAGQLAEAGMLAYNDKVKQFETEFLEPLLNGFLEMGRRLITGSDLVKYNDPTYNYTKFLMVTRDDLMQVGKIRPLGSRYANDFLSLLQGINTLFNSGATQFIAPHISRLKVAQLLADITGLNEYDIVVPDIGVVEDGQTQSMAMQVKQNLQSQAAAAQAPPSLEPGAIPTPPQDPLVQGQDTSGDVL